jgi:hypothetical protein
LEAVETSLREPLKFGEKIAEVVSIHFPVPLQLLQPQAQLEAGREDFLCFLLGQVMNGEGGKREGSGRFAVMFAQHCGSLLEGCVLARR